MFRLVSGRCIYKSMHKQMNKKHQNQATAFLERQIKAICKRFLPKSKNSPRFEWERVRERESNSKTMMNMKKKKRRRRENRALNFHSKSNTTCNKKKKEAHTHTHTHRNIAELGRSFTDLKLALLCHNNRSERQRVWADWNNHYAWDCGVNNRTTSSCSIGRASCGCSDDNTCNEGH